MQRDWSTSQIFSKNRTEWTGPKLFNVMENGEEPPRLFYDSIWKVGDYKIQDFGKGVRGGGGPANG